MKYFLFTLVVLSLGCSETPDTTDATVDATDAQVDATDAQDAPPVPVDVLPSIDVVDASVD